MFTSRQYVLEQQRRHLICKALFIEHLRLNIKIRISNPFLRIINQIRVGAI